jgi:hypothetical protein
MIAFNEILQNSYNKLFTKLSKSLGRWATFL